MGWMANKWAETSDRLHAALAPHIGSDALVGCVHAMRQSKMSAKQFAIGVTSDRLVIVEVDRKLRPTNNAPVSLRREEITVGNIFSEGAALSVGQKAQQIRFSARGEQHEYTILGGNVIENAFAGDDQRSGLDEVVQFLRRAPA